MVSLKDIENKIDGYLLLPNKSVIKLLCAFAVACKLPTEPPWLFLASGSSTGKTQLLVLLELIPGYVAVDDMTGNTLSSGMKRHDTSASLLQRIPKDGGFLAFSDFTVMLSKQKEELSKILGQLRVVFDGKMVKHTGGQIETQTWEGKAGLIAASTTGLYNKTEEYAEVGQRMVIYHMEQPDNYQVGKFRFQHSKDDRKAVRKEIQEMVRDYVTGLDLPAEPSELPEFDSQTQSDILDIAHLAVTARSPVTRNKFSRDQERTFRDDKEGIGRVQGQLMTIAYGLMVQNPDRKLTDSDRKLLFKLGLDCIDPRKRGVLQMLTEYSHGGNIEQIAEKIKYSIPVALRFVDDLYSLDMLEMRKEHTSTGTRSMYKLRPEFLDIMMRFENITVKEEALPEAESEKQQMGSLTPPPISKGDTVASMIEAEMTTTTELGIDF